MVRIGDSNLSAAVRTQPGFGERLRMSLPPKVDEESGRPVDSTADLDRSGVEELRDQCEAFLRGEPVR